MSRRLHNKKSETLEQVFERVIRDARAVNAPVTPKTLASAAGAAGWVNPNAELVREPSE